MKKKSFDCMAMKREIHEKILRDINGLSREERLKQLEKDISSDPILDRVWNRTTRTEKKKEPAASDK